jgi:methylenetetrahydrofolate dehydrogenase (NADP+)/methenyltetrahydrofolate cyclohydrolase
MSAKIIDGKAIAAEVRARVAAGVATLQRTHGLVPGLAVVLVGDDPASHVYVRSKGRQSAEVGMRAFDRILDAATTQADLLALVARLNGDASVHGILVQLPLPPQIDSSTVIDAVDPRKDVDGFNVVNVGRLVTGQESLVPCTPAGCVILAKRAVGALEGAEAVIVGRSNIVGKPLAQLLLRENCTVTVAHSRTRDLASVCRRADILVAAVGRAEMIRGDWVKPGACVIDVGINRVAGLEGKTRLVGDVAFEEARAVAGAITPVPGGVGPMTIALLLANTLKAACAIAGLKPPEIS